MPRPNILWICADDLAVSACSPYGNTVVKTPALHRFAESATTFTRAYCPAPLSTPSRMSFLTGRFPWSMGTTNSLNPLPDHEKLVSERLARVGYYTAAFGKTHYYSDLKRRFHCALDHTDYNEWLRRQPTPAHKEDVLPPWAPFADPAEIWLNSMGLPYDCPDEYMYGTFLAREVTDFLRCRRGDPFFAYVAFHETHSPFRFPYDFEYRCAPESVDLPPTSVRQEDIPLVFAHLTTDQRKGIVASYYTCASFLDRNVGRILGAVEEENLTEDTIVIFSSDHGYLLGEHGRFEKHCCYEAAVRIPLIMRIPGTRGGTTNDWVVNLTDVAPTLCQYADMQPVESFVGASLKPWFDGKESISDRISVSQYVGNRESCIVDGAWKLIQKEGRFTRRDGYQAARQRQATELALYDIVNDPHERHNLSEEYPELGAELLGKLIQSGAGFESRKK